MDIPMDISMDIHIHGKPVFAPPLNPLIYLMPYKQQNITSDSTAETNLTFAIEYSQFKCADSF